MTISRYSIIATVLILLLILLFFFDIILGSVDISFIELWNFVQLKDVDANTEAILLKFRLPKAVTAIFAGIALSVSGLQMQTVFRNPLAGPYVLGISAGASLGVALIVLLGQQFFWMQSTDFLGNSLLILFAWLGSAFVMFIILFVSMRVRDVLIILILGMMFGSGISAIVSILQYFSNESDLKVFVIWTMGSLSGITISQLYIFIPIVILGVFIVLLSVKSLNAMLLGEDYAQTLGINLRMWRIIIFFSTSILAGTVTAFCGPIGFIGIAVPHVTRILLQTSDHRHLLWGTSLIGANMLLFSDIIAQLPGVNMSLPINSITAILGIPIVIWIILSASKRSSFI